MGKKPKSISDIYGEFDTARKKHKTVEATLDKVRADLIAYYSTPEGRAEIDDSPHRLLSTEVAVDLLMQDVTIRAYKKEKQGK